MRGDWGVYAGQAPAGVPLRSHRARCRFCANEYDAECEGEGCRERICRQHRNRDKDGIFVNLCPNCAPH
jgi:hypothetical protein